MNIRANKRITGLALAAMLLALAFMAGCGSTSDSGGASSGSAGLLIGAWQRVSGDDALPDTLFFSKGGAGMAITDGGEAPFTWMLAGNVLINNLGGRTNQSTVVWRDDGRIDIVDLTEGTGTSTWARAE